VLRSRDFHLGPIQIDVYYKTGWLFNVYSRLSVEAIIEVDIAINVKTKTLRRTHWQMPPIAPRIGCPHGARDVTR